MTPLLIVAVLASSAAAAEAPSWLTVVGDPANAFVDTLEVDATSAIAFESMRLVKLRVNRARPRTGFDDQPYHSYYSTAVVDCTGLKAWHRSIALFSKPLWHGKMRLVEYAESDGRNLAFAEMEPNPRDRLIKAACAIALQSP
ncbi:hypothetical protein KW843_16075 [Acidovorax sp. sif1233]|uniref:surface-adhesin E family protein n=1 Tax=unclassified Acidovorax TaxID=2684926 RepID=UPI001C43F108|nr:MULTISPECIES: surface-adhesin E family protein [unclassified Acidovorax]MBV7428273.1 hypothetical protein [Acidovorax sp. sif0732]MBV7449530.1 hypothetical protein [Acidovorax sp. sif0715]MBV7455999.1 hypothetical protein [Acidovorax sp. sif1233]